MDGRGHEERTGTRSSATDGGYRPDDSPTPHTRRSNRAPLVWALGAAIPLAFLVVGTGGLVRARSRGCRGCTGWSAVATAVLGRDVRGRGAAVALPGAPLGDQPAGGVHPDRAGWCRNAASPRSSRVQTVDTYRGPLDRLFGLANVTVTTASSAGAVRIVALDADGGRRGGGAVDRHRGPRRRTTRRDAPPSWQRLSPRMLLVHPVHEVLRQLPLLISSLVLGLGHRQPVVGVARAGH